MTHAPSSLQPRPSFRTRPFLTVQVEDAVHAIVTMQPLPTASAAASPVPPSSPRAAAPAAAAAGYEWRVGEAAEAGAASDGGGSFRSAASDLPQSQSYRSAASGSSLSRTFSSGSSPADSGSSSASASPPPEAVEPRVPPPPRPGAEVGGGPTEEEEEEQQRPPPPEQQRQGQEPPATQPSLEEGLHAPPPTPAGSATVSPAPSPAVSPRVGMKAAAQPPPAGAVAAGPSAPASPATPFAAQQARPWQQQEAAPPGSPGALGDSPLGSPSASRQGVQGAWVPQRRSRLAVSDAASPAEQPAVVQWAVAPPAPAAPLASSGESRYAPPPSAASATAAPEPGSAAGAAAETAASHVRPGLLLPRAASGSSDEPQLTEVHGPWPPPLPSQQPEPQQAEPSEPSTARSPAPAAAHQRERQQSPTWAGGLASAFQQAPSSALPGARSPGWQHPHDDDGTWEQPGAEVDWAGAGAGSALRALSGLSGGSPAAAAGSDAKPEELLHDSLVDAAAHSPPLSPTTTRLLSLKHPSAELRRGPHRAASLAPGLAHHPPERQPSLLSPERQPSGRTHSTPSSPTAAWATAPGSFPPAAQPLPVSTSASSSLAGGGGSSSQASGLGHRSVSEQAPRQQPRQVQRMLPVLNTSPDVAAPGSLPAPPSPFRAPAPAASAPPAAERADVGGGTGSGAFGGLGGLPLEVVEKREHRRGSSADLSPREVRGNGFRGAAD